MHEKTNSCMQMLPRADYSKWIHKAGEDSSGSNMRKAEYAGVCSGHTLDTFEMLLNP